MVSEKIQQLVAQAQSYQQHLQAVMAQKEALSIQLMEISRALEELGKPGDDDVFKMAGPILVKVKRAESSKELESKKEIINLRLRSLAKNETRLKEQMDGMREKLENAGG